MLFRFYLIELTTNDVTGTNSLSIAMEYAAADNYKVIDTKYGVIRRWPDFPITVKDVYHEEICG